MALIRLRLPQGLPSICVEGQVFREVQCAESSRFAACQLLLGHTGLSWAQDLATV